MSGEGIFSSSEHECYRVTMKYQDPCTNLVQTYKVTTDLRVWIYILVQDYY